MTRGIPVVVALLVDAVLSVLSPSAHMDAKLGSLHQILLFAIAVLQGMIACHLMCIASWPSSLDYQRLIAPEFMTPYSTSKSVGHLVCRAVVHVRHKGACGWYEHRHRRFRRCRTPSSGEP